MYFILCYSLKLFHSILFNVTNSIYLYNTYKGICNDKSYKVNVIKLVSLKALSSFEGNGNPCISIL